MPAALITNAVGSYPKPDYLAQARIQFSQGKIDRAVARHAHDDEVCMAVRCHRQNLAMSLPVEHNRFHGAVRPNITRNQLA